jgi:hypothetical protein
MPLEVEDEPQLAKDFREAWVRNLETKNFVMELIKAREKIYSFLETNLITLSPEILRAKLSESSALTKTINLVKYARYEHREPISGANSAESKQ